MMKYKANFKSVITAHLIGIGLLSILWFFVGAEGQFILKFILGALIVSLIVQSIIYKIKPGWLNDKVNQHPDQL